METSRIPRSIIPHPHSRIFPLPHRRAEQCDLSWRGVRGDRRRMDLGSHAMYPCVWIALLLNDSCLPLVADPDPLLVSLLCIQVDQRSNQSVRPLLPHCCLGYPSHSHHQCPRCQGRFSRRTHRDLFLSSHRIQGVVSGHAVWFSSPSLPLPAGGGCLSLHRTVLSASDQEVHGEQRERERDNHPRETNAKNRSLRGYICHPSSSPHWVFHI